MVTEDAATALDGLMTTSLTFSNGIAQALLEVWKARRAQPALLAQPQEQWRDGRSSASRRFQGYNPGSIPFEADALVADPTLLRRLKAAALDAAARKKWDSFD